MMPYTQNIAEPMVKIFSVRTSCAVNWETTWLSIE